LRKSRAKSDRFGRTYENSTRIGDNEISMYEESGGMTQPDSHCPTCGAPIGKQQPSPTEPSAAKKNEDREIDHRGVVMPRRTRIGGIIMPQ
jgi:hypothetical protein